MPTEPETWPRDPIAAVTHPHPYPFYADLAARRPPYRDDDLGLWVAASAEAVTAVLGSPLCRVRPPAEPVPRALVGSPAGEIFRHLVRMNDGAGHCPFKQAVAAALASVEEGRVREEGARQALRLESDLAPTADAARLADFTFRLPSYVIAGLLGAAPEDLEPIALAAGDLVGCFAPGAGTERLESGKRAAGELWERFRAIFEIAARQDGDLAGGGSRKGEGLSTRSGQTPGGLLAALAREADRVGPFATDVVVANAIGFLSQAYEATAGLLGNALLALAAHPAAREELRAEPALLPGFLREVLRWDPPVQNTRRFVATAGMVAGQEMQEGDAILVVLAAANRDPVANPDPDRFDLHRQDRRIFTFGSGLHVCPGEALAVTIAGAGLERLLASGVEPEELARSVTYRPSGNVRVPVFGG
jgi:cytochrome P450